MNDQEKLSGVTFSEIEESERRIVRGPWKELELLAATLMLGDPSYIGLPNPRFHNSNSGSGGKYRESGTLRVLYKEEEDGTVSLAQYASAAKTSYETLKFKDFSERHWSSHQTFNSLFYARKEFIGNTQKTPFSLEDVMLMVRVPAPEGRLYLGAGILEQMRKFAKEPAPAVPQTQLGRATGALTRDPP